MAGKRSTKTTTRSSTRERSKSAGRATPKSRSRTPTRSRSRSQTASKTKRSRTPASESKVQRRRSSSSSSSPVPRKTVEAASRERKVVPSTIKSPIYKESLPSRFSQRIIHRHENTRSISTIERSASPAVRRSPSQGCQLCASMCAFFRERVCPSPILAALSLLTLLPLVFWLNLLVLSPVSPRSGSADTKISSGYPFAGVVWPTDIHFYFDFRSMGFVFGYLLLNVLLRLIPAGSYKGLLALLFLSGAYATAQFCKWGSIPSLRPSVLLPKYYLALLFATGKFATILSVVAFFASKRIPRSQVNPEGNTGNFFVDFWNGRSVRPRWFGIDWKMFILQPGCTAMMLIEMTYLYIQWERFGRLSPALVATVAMHSVWIIDLFLFEKTMMSSFEVRREGFGYYQIVGSLILPFLYGLPTVYLSSIPDLGRLYATDGRLNLKHVTMLGICIVLFVIGYWICRASNNQKSLFRTQPNHPTFAEMDKISGPHSQRLLAGGWWGIVRHPNYLGELITAYAVALLSGCYSMVPWLYPIFLTCFMVHRIWRVEYLCSEKYGLGMDMYKKLVPYVLVPRVF